MVCLIVSTSFISGPASHTASFPSSYSTMESTFVYTGQKTLEKEGISLIFPPAYSEKDINSIMIEVIHNNDFILPPQYKDMHIASGMYQITSSDKLPGPIRIRIEHCASMIKENTLMFMVAHGKSPYHFKPFAGGIFQECYGEIEVNEFSIFTIFQNIRDWSMRFAVHVFDCLDGTADFVVTKDIPEQKSTVKEQYCHARQIVQFTTICSFLTTEITLTMPQVPTDGWSVTPVVEPPTISMRKIHAYRTGHTIPNIKMILKWEGEGVPREDAVNIKVEGGDFTSFNLPWKTTSPQLSSDNSPWPSASDKPTLLLFQKFPMHCGQDKKVIQAIAPKKHDLCIRLLNDEDGTITQNIEDQYKNDTPHRITEAILQKWLEGFGRTPQTWTTFITVLREIELFMLAKDIEDTLHP